MRKSALLMSLVLISGFGQAQQVSIAQTTRGKTTDSGMTSASVLARLVTINVQNTLLTEVLSEINRQANLQLAYSQRLIPITKRVSISVANVTAAAALQKALVGTGVVARIGDNNAVNLVRANGKSVGQGVITGKVTDARSGKGVPRASVSINADTRVGTTDEDGAYRISGISAGVYIVSVRLVGYAKQTRSVTIGETAAVTVDFKLEPSANVLDQVVVTGTVASTELRAVPNAITVITAKQIEERGITKIDQLFRGDVPGLFAANFGSGAVLGEVTMFSRGATALSSFSADLSPDPLTGGVLLTNPIKTYVDGVELADPKYISQIDPRSIERIEILAGPQASTIYGSNAINGVMQIFTKRGSTYRPQLSLGLMSGWVENNFSSSHTPQHDYNAQLNGVEGKLSYNVGGSWNYMGPWTPANQSTRTGGFGSTRFDLPTSIGRFTADITLRRSNTQNRQRGDARQTRTGYGETGWWISTNTSTFGLMAPTTNLLNGQTLGVQLSYAPLSWWSHEIGMGNDASDIEIRRTGRGYLNLSDTTLLLSQSHTDRRSLHYSTTARVPVASFAQVTVTAGADVWQKLTSSWSVLPQVLTGPLTGSTSVSRHPGHNAGGFLQSQVGMDDRLFLTYGLRVEQNPGYGEKARVIPGRYGLAYTQEFGLVTAKLRGSYGRSTRPPEPELKRAQKASEFFSAFSYGFISPFYDPFDHNLANPELLPEYQQGGEGGVELYFGSLGSLVVTRYNQTVDGLIDRPKVDSARSSVLCAAGCSAEIFDADGYGYFYQYQYLNIGTIRNQGWELQSSVNLGPLTTHGTYSWTKSRTIGITPRYRAQFPALTYPQYQLGATFRYLPEHTWALGATYSKSSSSIGINLTGTGRATIFQDDFYFEHLFSSIRLPQNRFNVTTQSYVQSNSGYTLADINATHRFVPRVEAVLQVHNLTDYYKNDFYSAYASIGRQLKAGFRVSTH